jgi:hypothetical protein
MNLHPRFTSTLVAAGLALAVVTLNAGCFAVVAAGAGAGAVAYVRGELESAVDANFDRALRASQRTIEQLQFAKVSEKKDALVATLLARNADDKRIEIRVESEGTNRAKVKIRVGIIGDESLSLTILDKIKSNL